MNMSENFLKQIDVLKKMFNKFYSDSKNDVEI
jgi:hypothetical protein